MGYLESRSSTECLGNRWGQENTQILEKGFHFKTFLSPWVEWFGGRMACNAEGHRDNPYIFEGDEVESGPSAAILSEPTFFKNFGPFLRAFYFFSRVLKQILVLDPVLTLFESRDLLLSSLKDI